MRDASESMTQPTPAIEATGLTKRYGSTAVVDNVDLRVEQGGRLWVPRSERCRENDNDADTHDANPTDGWRGSHHGYIRD